MLNDPRYRAIAVRIAPKRISADIAHQFWAIPREHIVVEDRSTNQERTRALPGKCLRRGHCPSYGRGDSGSDHAAQNDGDVCPRLARRPASADVVQHAGVRASIVQRA